MVGFCRSKLRIFWAFFWADFWAFFWVDFWVVFGLLFWSGRMNTVVYPLSATICGSGKLAFTQQY